MNKLNQIILKKQFKIILWLNIILILLVNPLVSHASELSNLSSQTASNQVSDREELDFDLLGYPDQIMQGPFDRMQLFFGLPSTWEIIDNVMLDLQFNVLLDSIPESNNQVNGVLDVEINGNLLDRIIIDEGGEQSSSLIIPQDKLKSNREDGQMMLQLSLTSDGLCRGNEEPRILIRDSSRFIIPHQLTQPTTNLNLLPQPLYQNTFEPNVAFLVIPDKPSAKELQAAFTVAASFGKMTNGDLLLDLVPESNLTPEIKDNHHIIVVGHTMNFPWLEQARLPLPVNSKGFSSIGSSEDDDGVIQMSISPWNSGKVLLVVSGNTDEGIIKAAQALNIGNVRTGSQTNIAFVSEVHLDRSKLPPIISQSQKSFTSLGYGPLLFSGLGVSNSAIIFFVPPNQVPANDGHLELSYYHSAFLNDTRSIMTIFMNGEPISSVRLKDETTGQSKLNITLPSSTIRAGTNSLYFEADLFPVNICGGDILQERDIWLNINPSSNLQLPVRQVERKIETSILLSDYPDNLNNNSILDQSAIIVPFNDPVALQAASKIIFDLGQYINSESVIDLIVLDGRNNDLLTELDRDYLIFGQSTQIPVLRDLVNYMPAPVNPSSNRIDNDFFPVTYRLPINLDVGYLQLFPAPWNPGRTIFAILGNTDLGLKNAVDVLLNVKAEEPLAGNLVISDGEQIYITNTRTENNNQVQSEANLEKTSLLRSSANRQFWLLPALIVSVGLIMLIIGYLLISAFRKRRLPV